MTPVVSDFGRSMRARKHVALCKRCAATALALLLAIGQLSPAQAQPQPRAKQAAPDSAYSPPLRKSQTNLYWGDTHLHSSLSADAYTTGTRLTSDQAYRFARGRAVTADNGVEARLRRPLDFLAVSDHAEYLGIYARLDAGDRRLQKWPLGKRWAEYLRTGDVVSLAKEFSDAIQSSAPKYQVPDKIRVDIWKEAAAVADKYNEAGLFTAFVAYEWTSMITGDNLHRVVLFKDGAETVTKILPFSAQESPDPEDLWAALAEYERKTGGEVLAIAHNGNVSNGRMFAPNTVSGEPLDTDYASRRARWEPVYEVTQVKGDGEAHPVLSPTDEFADFETWDEGNITLSTPKEPWMLRYEYARSGLQEGLKHEAKLGANPFKFGMIGATDSHTGLSTPAEDNFFGKFLESEPQPERATNKMAHQLQESWQLGASGLAGVWAEENSRGALFAAIKRREVYATTGPRIRVRFFGGWAFGEEDLLAADYAARGYDKGVPMGGDLSRDGKGDEAPCFMVMAVKEPEGANLDRIQIIKGWVDDAGETQEKIYDVALSDGRGVDPATGKAPPVGNTVDVENASYTNAIGDPQLAAVWTDPDFNPDQRAFYYVRVLEIPKPRWTAYDARYFGIEMPEEAPMIVQDRAYTSPIWYSP